MKRWLTILLLAATLTAGLPAAPPRAARAAPDAPARIMPLGDSITASMNGFASYRCWLWKNLTDLGYSIDFVGSQTGVAYGETSCPYPADMDHEGHSGWTSQQLRDLIYATTWTNANTPDVALIHIGTAALCAGETVDTIKNNDSQIIDRLRSANANVKVLLAQIIPAAPQAPDYNATCLASLTDENIRALNAQVAALAASKSTPSSPVTAVNMYAGYDAYADNIGDHVHPNQSGETKIANRWTWALVNTLGGLNRRVYLPMNMR